VAAVSVLAKRLGLDSVDSVEIIVQRGGRASAWKFGNSDPAWAGLQYVLVSRGFARELPLLTVEAVGVWHMRGTADLAASKVRVWADQGWLRYVPASALPRSTFMRPDKDLDTLSSPSQERFLRRRAGQPPSPRELPGLGPGSKKAEW
jgi:hypothetical protein